MADPAQDTGEGNGSTAREEPRKDEGREGVREEHRGSVQTGRPERLDPPDGVDWRGWLLVALVVLCFVVIPLFVLYIPEMHWLIGRLGFSRRQAYILFPMLPAVLLGVTAVWVALRTYTE